MSKDELLVDSNKDEGGKKMNIRRVGPGKKRRAVCMDSPNDDGWQQDKCVTVSARNEAGQSDCWFLAGQTIKNIKWNVRGDLDLYTNTEREKERDNERVCISEPNLERKNTEQKLKTVL